MSLACYEHAFSQDVSITINGIAAGVFSVYCAHLLANRRSRPAFHFIRAITMGAVFTRLIVFSMFKGGVGTNFAYNFAQAYVLTQTTTVGWQWARHVIVALYFHAFGEPNLVRSWKVIIPAFQVVVPVLVFVLIFGGDAVFNSGDATLHDILLNSLIIFNLIFMFGVLFTIHADAFRKVRAMARRDDKILKKISRSMAVTFIAAIALLGVCLSQVIGGATSSAEEEVSLEPPECDVANHIFLEVATEVFAFAVLYHTDVKPSGEAARRRTRSGASPKPTSIETNPGTRDSSGISTEQAKIEILPTEK